MLQVRCRKPEELELGLSEADVRQLEQEFIQGHPELSQASMGVSRIARFRLCRSFAAACCHL